MLNTLCVSLLTPGNNLMRYYCPYFSDEEICKSLKTCPSSRSFNNLNFQQSHHVIFVTSLILCYLLSRSSSPGCSDPAGIMTGLPTLNSWVNVDFLKYPSLGDKAHQIFSHLILELLQLVKYSGVWLSG